jgi:hypothetical protein
VQPARRTVAESATERAVHEDERMHLSP